MAFLRHGFFRLFLAMAVLSLFGGDLVADALHDAFWGCTAESPQQQPCKDKGACPSCACAVHNGTVVFAEASLRLLAPREMDFSFPPVNEHPPLGVPVPIEYPPQLA